MKVAKEVGTERRPHKELEEEEQKVGHSPMQQLNLRTSNDDRAEQVGQLYSRSRAPSSSACLQAFH